MRYLILPIAIVAALVYKAMFVSQPQPIDLYPNDNRVQELPAGAGLDESDDPIGIGRLNSPYAILIKLKDNRILMAKNSGEKIYPASLTKIMTVITAIENLPDLETKIQLSNSMYQRLHDENATLAGFQGGEKVRAIDLLYGAMLPSGAECCIGLAEKIGGSEQGFVNIMNKKAKELGMSSTHFANTTGLHSSTHYTTVKDMAVLLNYALKNDTFREIFTSFRHSAQPTNKHPGGITFYSTLFDKIAGTGGGAGGKILGGKTGYTLEAGLCLASLGQSGGEEYILVTAGAKGNQESEQYNITDALTVYGSLGK